VVTNNQFISLSPQKVCFTGKYEGDLGLYTEYLRENNRLIPLDPQKVSFASQYDGGLVFYTE